MNHNTNIIGVLHSHNDIWHTEIMSFCNGAKCVVSCEWELNKTQCKLVLHILLYYIGDNLTWRTRDSHIEHLLPPLKIWVGVGYVQIFRIAHIAQGTHGCGRCVDGRLAGRVLQKWPSHYAKINLYLFVRVELDSSDVVNCRCVELNTTTITQPVGMFACKQGRCRCWTF
jgi:hypothetical protein